MIFSFYLSFPKSSDCYLLIQELDEKTTDDQEEALEVLRARCHRRGEAPIQEGSRQPHCSRRRRRSDTTSQPIDLHRRST